MKKALYFLACLAPLVACTPPVTTSQRTVTVDGNILRITSGTVNGGRLVSVENTQKMWEGNLKGGKEKWIARRDFLFLNARQEIEHICGQWFFTLNKEPIYNMLDSDETMGGVAPALGVAVSMVAYLAAEAATQDTNIPASVHIEFKCMND